MKKLIIVFLFASCGKEQLGVNEFVNCNEYKEVINYYDLDTLPLKMQIGAATGQTTFIWWKDTICDQHIAYSGKDTLISYEKWRKVLDSSPEQWSLMCAQPGQPFQWLEQRYYEKNGIRILPKTKYPIKPLKQ